MQILKKLTPHFVAIVLFLMLSSVYFSPLFNGYTLRQGDVKQYRGMAKEIDDYRMMNEGEAMWTNSMFGGMPAYQISIDHPSNVLKWIHNLLTLNLPIPVGILFISMLGFYILGLCLRINPWLSILGAIAFGFSSFNVLYIGAGHITKVTAVAYIAPTLGGLLLAFRGNKLLGSAIFMLFFGLNLTANHLQITYYLSILLGIVAIGESIRLLLEKKALELVKVGGVLLLGGALAVMPSASNLMTTYEYSKYTTRGATDLTIEPDGKKKDASTQKGLNKDYILDYNYSPGEFLSVAIPNAKGGKDDYIGNNESAMENMESDYADQVAQSNQYWGGQRFSGGAIYLGAIIVGLFILGLIFVKDTLKWPFLALGLLIVFLVGKENAVNDFFLNQFPMYNKFRDSKMILVVLQVIAPALALLFVDKLMKKEGLLGNQKTWLFGFLGVGAIFILLILFPSISGSFIKDTEVKQFSDAISSTKDQTQISAINGIKSDLILTRISIFRSDAIRSFLFFGAAGLLLLANLKFKISHKVILALLALLILGDQMSICKRYLNNEIGDLGYESYEEKQVAQTPYAPENADNYILNKEKRSIGSFDAESQKVLAKMKEYHLYSHIQDDNILQQTANFSVLNSNTNYRVLNFNNPFNETGTSYFHKSIGGYHGAKLKRYQELIDFYIGNEMQVMNRLISQEKMQKLRGIDSLKIDSQEKAKAIFDTISVAQLSIADSTPILNMLNTKYIILDKAKNPIENAQANGNAWFVSDYVFAGNANDEMKALKGFNSKKTVVINNKEISNLSKEFGKFSKSSTDKISLTKYSANNLVYASESQTTLPAVFSEIWYPEGWNCYIDGKKTDKIFRANYVLRGAIIPAGKHKIEWKFEPQTYFKSTTYSLIGSIGLILGCVLIFGLNLKNSFLPKE
ncbi:MAG: hypothetical protein ACKO5W_03785 [Crocinitomicaceae bacterium]